MMNGVRGQGRRCPTHLLILIDPLGSRTIPSANPHRNYLTYTTTSSLIDLRDVVVILRKGYVIK